MPARSYDARHRASRIATAKPRRLFAGLALPTAAAAALTFAATGAAVSTSGKSQSVTFSQNAPAATATSKGKSNAMDASASLDDPRSQAIEDNALAIAREKAGAAAARSAERKSLAARAKEAKRVAQEAKLIAQAESWQPPLKNSVQTSSFGWRWGRMHKGEDFAASVGTDLVAMSTGTVIFAGEKGAYGNLVEIRYWDGTVTYYAHMSGLSVTEGENVEPGEVVGQSGNTGGSTGPHLHLEIHPDGGEAVEPTPWLAEHSIAI